MERNDLRRHLRTIQEIHGARIKIGARELLNFSSNDYLGLSAHPALAEAMAAAAARWGVGATASRLICGTTAEHASLEEELAAAKPHSFSRREWLRQPGQFRLSWARGM